ncbi:tetratricopeptide repeat protein [Oceanibaculum pacificum]|uniref:Tetratricopeptide repeat-like domain-containing protein n=1 Tax=Oceanibaculum pacificum TaxID=580166 RepID=A0A154WHA0_9PROT|nr:tetratricopeptide repeat protein [Oceanibaculum pacificum]KZD12855.1 hypothetical protein AUP43_00505 [Oceanibaculum pacificum]
MSFRFASLAVAGLIGLGAALPACTTASPAEAARMSGASVGSYLAGQHAYRLGDYTAAADYMSQALAADPDNPALLRRVLILQVAEGRIASLSSLADRVARLAPDDPVAGLLLALESARAKDYERAIAYVEPLETRGLGRLVRPLILGWLQAGKGDITAATEALNALAGDPGLTLLKDFHTGLIMDLVGEPQAAEVAFERTLATVSAPPLRLVQALGSFYERNGKIEQARNLYTDYLARMGEDDRIQRRLDGLGKEPKPQRLARNPVEGLAEALYDIATGLRRDRAVEVSLIYARLALHIRPEEPISRILVGELLQDQKRFERAIEVFDGVPKDSSYRWEVDMAIAESLNGLDRSEEAAAKFEDLAARDKTRIEPLVRIGDLKRAAEDYPAAITAYDRAVARLTEPVQRNWSLYYVRGIAHERAKQWEAAERDFLRALELQPEQPLVLNYLAYSWTEQGIKLDQAHEMIERAVAQRPSDGYIIDSLGWVLYQQQRYDDAVRQLERAIELMPHDPTINDHLGDAYWQVGRRTEARFQWQRVISLKPEDKELEAKVRSKLADGLASRN